jgi:hypothetical protein
MKEWNMTHRMSQIMYAHLNKNNCVHIFVAEPKLLYCIITTLPITLTSLSPSCQLVKNATNISLILMAGKDLPV